MTVAPQYQPIPIKRYGRSVYDTVGARYLTVADLKEWSAQGVPFIVIETGDDVTQVLLA